VEHVRGGMPKQTPEGYNRPLEGQEDVWKPWDKERGGYWEGGTHWSEIVADDAEKFLEMAGESENPFFMYISFNAVHDPRQSPRDYVEMYPLDSLRVPESYIPEHPYKDYIDCSARLRDEKLAPFPRTEHSVKKHIQEYYAIATHMDAQIGRIMAALEKSGKKENTYIFFTADHGLAVGKHGLLGKQNMYEHSLRAPFFVIGPDAPKGKKINAPIYLQDVMPSSLELAGVAVPEHIQFKSVMPLVRGKTGKSYDAIYGGYLKSQRAVIAERHKLILFPEVKKYFLYDLKRDPLELINLADDSKKNPLVGRLFAQLLALQEETGDENPITSLDGYSSGPKRLSDIQPLVKENKPAKKRERSRR
jgi:arylsulfatase A-like enzyme